MPKLLFRLVRYFVSISIAEQIFCIAEISATDPTVPTDPSPYRPYSHSVWVCCYICCVVYVVEWALLHKSRRAVLFVFYLFTIISYSSISYFYLYSHPHQ